MFLMNLYLSIYERLFRSHKREKDELRACLAQRRRILNSSDVEMCSREVVEQIVALPEYQQAQKVMIYYPIHNEINLLSLTTLSPEKTFLLPVAHRHSLEIREYQGEQAITQGKFGVPVPTTPTFLGKIDLILVPGVAFDNQGNRMGRGGGYYDRFLRHYSHTMKIGVGYRFQLKNKLPHDRHDTPLDKVILSNTK